jgi:hypothetical protein
MLTVYKQRAPIPTSERVHRYSEDGASKEVWHIANLEKIGEVETWEQAKLLCAAPIVSAIRK